ncbi:AAA family ATPase [Candidatus Saccharibacteria bacterium]|nr:AAA family ATPase [Candidatus Saccharibacteria bacterium]
MKPLSPEPPIILAFVGMPGSGKGTCTDFLEAEYHFPVVHFGSMVYEEVQRRGLDNVEDEKFVREDMRAKEGPATLAMRSARKAEDYFAEGHAVVVFDGLYSWSEFKYLDEKYGDRLITIALAAARAERHRRVVERKDGHRRYTYEQVRARDINEIEHLEKGGPIAYADFTIVNSLDQADLRNQLAALLAQLGIHKPVTE